MKTNNTKEDVVEEIVEEQRNRLKSKMPKPPYWSYIHRMAWNKELEEELDWLRSKLNPLISNTKQEVYKKGYKQGNFDGSMNAKYNDDYPYKQ